MSTKKVRERARRAPRSTRRDARARTRRRGAARAIDDARLITRDGPFAIRFGVDGLNSNLNDDRRVTDDRRRVSMRAQRTLLKVIILGDSG